jgi:hypothetical protein
MDQWNIKLPDLRQDGQRVVQFHNDADLDFQKIVYYASTGIVNRFDLYGHLQRMENYPPREVAANLFVTDPSLGISFGKDWLVCPVRGSEVLSAIHSGYTLIPLDFYEAISKVTGLKLVFMGQIEDNEYCSDLRKRFKGALFIRTQGALEDFQTIRKSRNIILCISTFAWLAAWFSDAQRIFLPMFGLFNTHQFTGFNFLPISDVRYKFFQFPVHEAVPVAEYANAHRTLEGRWHEVAPENLIGEVLG